MYLQLMVPRKNSYVVQNTPMMKLREKPMKLRAVHEMKQLMELKAVMKQRT
jgi:hypothetical protein